MSDQPSWSREPEQWRPWLMDELDRPREERPEPHDQRLATLRQQAAKRNAEFEALREQARQDASRQGYDEGYDEGFAAGRADGYAYGVEEGRQAGEQAQQEQTREALEPLLALSRNFAQALEQLDGQIAEHLVDLALATARQLAGEALKAEPEQILPIIRDLLHSEPALTGQPRLWLNPADLPLVKTHLGGELEAAGWKLQPDALITRGGCRASGASGELDATWEARWAGIARQVRKRQSAATVEEEAVGP
ncbi:flagellar assembly protein FliH [Azotobacter armeniacus]